MCKIGDIIAVKKFIGDGNNFVNLHYFVVISDDKGCIGGLSFDIVSVVMSSFKNNSHKIKKLKHIENIEINASDGTIGRDNLKNGYIKVDQLFYFKKKKTKYFVVGQVDGDVLLKIIEHLNYLDSQNLLKQNIYNL